MYYGELENSQFRIRAKEAVLKVCWSKKKSRDTRKLLAGANALLILIV